MNYADEVSVLRAGRMVKSVPVAETNPAELSEAMMGHATLQRSLDKKQRSFDKNKTGSFDTSALELRGLSVPGDSGLLAVTNVSLHVNRGEILGLAGVSGNGQRELVQAIAGQRPMESGQILAFGQPFRPRRREIVAAGLFTLPEEPLESATVASMSVEENMALRRFDRPPLLRWRWFMNRAKVRGDAASAIKSFSIRPPRPDAMLRHLSGGNLRKVVLSRELIGGEVRILVVANPTVGLDFSATAFLHEQLVDLRNSGGALLVVSEDLDELMALSDRIAVMSGGVVTYEVETAKADRAVIGSYFGGETSHPIER
jgi:simple sugar transport system ATP-binding protein